MASVNEKELSRIIKSGEASGVYYLYGTDHYTIEKYTRAMIDSVVKKGDETYNLHRFQGRDLDVEGMSDACEGFPMFADKLCVTVCDLDMEEETKARQSHSRIDETRLKLLYDTVSDLPETTVLIFYTANIDICGGKKYPSPKNKKLADLISKNGTVCEINIKSRNEVIKIISARISKQGGSIEEAAAGLVYDNCCGNMNMIMNEIDKLSAFSNGNIITVNDVEMLTPDYNDAKSYDLADAAAAGNASRTMQLYNELIAKPENTPVYLLYVLTGSMNDLYRARLALDYNHSMSDVSADFGYAKNVEFRLKKAFSSVRRLSAAHLRNCIEILAQADIDMKTGAGVPEVILETAIIKMLAGGK